MTRLSTTVSINETKEIHKCTAFIYYISHTLQNAYSIV